VALRSDRDTPIELFINLVMQKLDEKKGGGGTLPRYPVSSQEGVYAL
jgi:hypothetical protein